MELPIRNDVLEQAAAWNREGKQVAIATVVETWGSSPRPPGSRLVVNDSSQFVGSVSGGCIEGAVVTEALSVMADKKPRMLEFGVTNEMAWEVGLACGGRVRVFVEAIDDGAMKPEALHRILQDQREKRAVVLSTKLPTGEHELFYPGAPGNDGVDRALSDAVESAARRDQSVTVTIGDASYFLSPFNPPLRLVLVGAVHIAQPLSQMAALAGFDVVVVDPRTAFSTEARFPGISRLTSWPDKALTELGLTARTAVVTLTHDPKLDDPALMTALASDAFYVGCLGSGKTHAARIERLKKRGLEEASLSRIFGPVGLRIGARSPAEIAVSILAQIIEQLRQGKT